MRIAAILTCYNRKELTIACLSSLKRAVDFSEQSFDLDTFLTDDGSTDGTTDAVKENFPETRIIQGTGNLYWAGGMRLAWEHALKFNYDAYLLLNDDTVLEQKLFDTLFLTHQYALKQFGKPGIYVGATKDETHGKITYGGRTILSYFLANSKLVIPNKEPQPCDLGNANIMMVSRPVVEKIGILSKNYIHGIADYDYTLRAKKQDFPVLVAPDILGICKNDHKSPYVKLESLSFKERKKVLYDPLALDFKSYMNFMRSHFPMRAPFVYLSGWLKVISPKLYLKLSKLR